MWCIVMYIMFSIALHYSGTVIGPTFQFDTTHINFGTISYGEYDNYTLSFLHTKFTQDYLFLSVGCSGFLSTREVTLTNTSEIPMTYRLRVSGNQREEEEEGEGEEEREFEVKPKSGVLPPNYHQNIKVRV